MKQAASNSGGKYVFGPVPSRRLGRSLGVDIVPRKVCTLDCVYCQVGRTTELTVERGDFVPVEAVLADLQAALVRGPRPDYVTISGSGEPTLNVRLGEIIAGVRKITDVPVAIITNGTLLGEADVRRDCAGADLVAPSLDAGDEATYQRINRPTRGLTLAGLVDGLAAFRREFAGKYWLEVFVVAGVNDSPEQVAKMRGLIERINPDRVQVNTATRPTAEAEVGAVPAARLAEIARELGLKAEVIAEFKAKAAPSPYPLPSRERGEEAAAEISPEAVLALILRRPVTAEDIAAGLGAASGEVARVVAALGAAGRITVNHRGGKIYYEAAAKK
jgi:wyosine [tRNA(Phe)-imidazoG37] synthetase (radical SAM superfamily)